MKLNEHQAILSPQVLLVPYSERHVPTYHEWMQDEDLQKATASEPLTLAEEYSMQKSWRNDADKLTFIACTTPSEGLGSISRLEPGKPDTPENMIGDVNLFLYEDEEDEEDAANTVGRLSDPATKDELSKGDWLNIIGEIEIMIAKKTLQGKGLGQMILMTFMWYIVMFSDNIIAEYHASNSGDKAETRLKYLRVKIDSENTRSIRLFERVGFKKVDDKPNYFGELELRWSIPMRSNDIEWRLDAMPLIIDYPERGT